MVNSLPLLYTLYHHKRNIINHHYTKFKLSLIGIKTRQINSIAKKNKIISIVGSGSSINQIDFKSNPFFNNVDFLTFNFSILSNFTKGLSVYEFLTDNSINIDFVNYIHQSNKSHLIVIKNSNILLKNWKYFNNDQQKTIKKQFIFVGEDLIPSQSKRLFELYFNKHKLNSNRPISLKTTLIFSISIAIILGYEQIVLCGVDLKNPMYFFQEEKFISLNKNIMQYFNNKHKSIQNIVIHNSIKKDNSASLNELLEVITANVKVKIQLMTRDKNNPLNEVLDQISF